MRSSKRITKRQKNIAPPVGFRQGKWSELEHRAMFTFVKSRRANIIGYLQDNLVNNVRSNKRMFFIDMAEAIKTKSDRQCKSRYQKQELLLMRALNLPAHLMEKFQTQRNKPAFSPESVKKLMEFNPTETTITSEQALPTDESQHASIYTFRELREALHSELIPQIPNQSIRTEIEHFISILPVDESEPAEMPSFCHNSISLIMSHINVSFINRGIKADSFFEE